MYAIYVCCYRLWGIIFLMFTTKLRIVAMMSCLYIVTYDSVLLSFEAKEWSFELPLDVGGCGLALEVGRCKLGKLIL